MITQLEARHLRPLDKGLLLPNGVIAGLVSRPGGGRTRVAGSPGAFIAIAPGVTTRAALLA